MVLILLLGGVMRVVMLLITIRVTLFVLISGDSFASIIEVDDSDPNVQCCGKNCKFLGNGYCGLFDYL